jgi:hypothetical protein
VVPDVGSVYQILQKREYMNCACHAGIITLCQSVYMGDIKIKCDI